jgi:hypothetical protein
MNKIYVTPDNVIYITRGEESYIDTLSNYEADTGQKICCPNGIRYMEFSPEDGRVIGHTTDGNQVEVKEIDPAIFLTAMDGVSAAVNAQKSREIAVAPPEPSPEIVFVGHPTGSVRSAGASSAGARSAGPNELKPISKRVGDFYATFISGNRGDIFRWYATKKIRRSEVALRKVVVSGELEMIEKPAGSPNWPIETRGSDSKDLPDIEPGNYVVRCNEDNTMWIMACAMTQDDPEPFESAVHVIGAGETITVPAGGILVLGSGRLSDAGRVLVGPTQDYVRAETVFTALDPVIAVSAWR